MAQNFDVILVSLSETTPLGDLYLSLTDSWNNAVNSGADKSLCVGINRAIFVNRSTITRIASNS